MTPEWQQELEQYVAWIAQILHQEAQAQGLLMLRRSAHVEIEATVREQMQAHGLPQIGIFLSTRSVPCRSEPMNEP